MSGRKKTAFSILLLAAVVSAVYGKTAGYSFHFDDNFGIIENESIRSLSNTGNIWDFYSPRFLAYLSFAANYRFNGLDPAGYRLVNIIIHALASTSVFFLILLALRSPPVKGAVPPGREIPAALLPAVIFAVHPVQTQAVTYIYQRLASMAALFYTASLVFYAKSSFSEKRGGVYLAVSASAFLLAIFTKETALTLPAAVLLYDVCFVRTPPKKLAKKMAPYAVILLAGLFVIFFSGTVPEIKNLEAFMEGRPSPNPPAAHYLFTQFRVVATYLRLIFFPAGQNVDYDYPLYSSVFSAPVFFSLLLHSGIIAFAGMLYRKRRLVSFGILFFYLALIPESSVVPLGAIDLELIFEHRLYLPMAGAAAALSGALILPGKKRGLLAACAACAAAVVLSGAAFARNRAWESEYTLWKDAVSKSPEKPRALVNFSRELLLLERPDEAALYARKALEYAPGNKNALLNLGLSLIDMKMYGEARQYLFKAREADPGNLRIINDIGISYFNEGDYESALNYYREVLSRAPETPVTLYNKGNVYERMGDSEKALHFYSLAISSEPGGAKAYNNRGVVLMNLGENIKALDDFTSAIQADPDYATAYLNRAHVLIRMGNEEAALRDLFRARELGVRFE